MQLALGGPREGAVYERACLEVPVSLDYWRVCVTQGDYAILDLLGKIQELRLRGTVNIDA